MRRLQESGASDEDYYARALVDYEAETETTGGSKRYKSSRSGSFNKEFGEASINSNANVGDEEEDKVQEIRGPMGRDKAKDIAKNKGSRASGSSSMNDEALARLMVTQIANQEKEERVVFLEIKRREVECHERDTCGWNVLGRQNPSVGSNFPHQSVSINENVFKSFYSYAKASPGQQISGHVGQNTGEIRDDFSVLYNDGCIKDCMEKNLEDDVVEILEYHSQGYWCGNVTTDDNEDVLPVYCS
ncbi:hypothetical protein Tco_1491770 [Tanacetum coccineum]